MIKNKFFKKVALRLACFAKASQGKPYGGHVRFFEEAVVGAPGPPFECRINFFELRRMSGLDMKEEE